MGSAFRTWAVLVLAGATACMGTATMGDEAGPGSGGEGGGTNPGAPGAGNLLSPQSIGPIAVRRLSSAEIRWSLFDVLGVDLEDAIGGLPVDERVPFDNDYTTQNVSPGLVSGLDVLGRTAGERFAEDPNRVEAVAGCRPAGPSDGACFETLALSLGRRLLRRPFGPTDVADYVGFLEHAEAEGDFGVAARMLVRALVQDPEFVYRFEFGEPVAGKAGLFKLNDHEVATRLSFLLWGSGPDDNLLDLASQGRLADQGGRSLAALQMLQDARADRQLQRFHEMWLNYKESALPAALVPAMAAETEALIRRVVLEEDRPYQDLLLFEETFVDSALAAHYGLPDPGATPAWVAYPDTRRGILSQAMYLSTASNFGDTSPVMRGKNVNDRLLCRVIPEPPPDVDIDEPPMGVGPDACRAENYNMATNPNCESCHRMIDPIGFGLEQYGPGGEYRAHEPGRPECVFAGDGAVQGHGSFRGPGELGQVVVDSGEFESCFTNHFLHFAVGRQAATDEAPTVDALAEEFQDKGHLIDFVLAFVAMESFGYRAVEEY